MSEPTENSHLLSRSNSNNTTLPQYMSIAIEQEEAYENQNLKSMAFGGYDGLVTSLIIFTACWSMNLSIPLTQALGVSIVTACSFSVGIGEFLTSRAHRELVYDERRKIIWDFQYNKENELESMIQSFQSKGMNTDDAHKVVDIMSKYENFFISYKLLENIGGNFNENFDNSDLNFLKDSFFMMFFFLSFGILPYFFLFLSQIIYSVVISNISFLANSNFFIFSLSFLFSLFILLYLNSIKNLSTDRKSFFASIVDFSFIFLCFAISFLFGFFFYYYYFF